MTHLESTRPINEWQPARPATSPNEPKTETPQPLLREIPPGQNYPVAALGPLKTAVEAVQGKTLAPVALPAQSALAVASLAVQGFANVETLGGSAPLSLYCLTIAQSGERKSSCDSLMLEFLRVHERKMAMEYDAASEAFKNRHALWKGDRDAILQTAKKAKGAKRTAAQVDLEALGAEPSAPLEPQRTVTEPTYEGLIRLFAYGQPSLGIFSDEGGQFMGGFAMNSDNRQKTLSAFNDLWQANPVKRTRQGDGAYTLFERRLAVHLMVQPIVARLFMADGIAGGTGFLARFLITQPLSTIGTRFQSKVKWDPAVLLEFSERLKAILETTMPTEKDGQQLKPRALPLSDGARMLLVQFSDEIEAQQAPSRDLAHVTAYASKAAEHAARIAGVLTLWTDLDTPEISSETIAQGIALARYYLCEAQRLVDASAVTAETEQAEFLRHWLIETWPAQARRNGRDPATVLPTDAMRLGPNSLREAKTVKALMAVLADSGWLVRLADGAVVDRAKRKLAYRIVRPPHDG